MHWFKWFKGHSNETAMLRVLVRLFEGSRQATRDVVETVEHVRRFWQSWPLHLAATPALDRRSVRCGPRLDRFVPVLPYSADLIQRSIIGDVRCSIWGYTRLSAWTAVVYSVHSGTSSCRRQTVDYISTQTTVKSTPARQLSAPGPAAVDQLSTCLVDAEAWLKATRLRLNPRG